MNLPLNGRIAIIDNEIGQVLPLMKIFAKNQMPYIFYKGDDLSYLPDENSKCNDIRLLFLDINLLNSRTASEKEVKSTLYAVLKRVISIENFPYSLIYWSRQENEYSKVVEKLFEEELSDRKPIKIIPFIKSELFPDFSDKEEPNNLDLLREIENRIITEFAYSYLLAWENHVHFAADQTLQQVFDSYNKNGDWTNNANYILEKLGKAYLQKHFSDNEPSDRIKASFISFSSVLKDTLEHNIYCNEIKNPKELTFDSSKVVNKISAINQKLNLSMVVRDICEPGNVVEFFEDNGLFGQLLNHIISFFRLKSQLKQKQIEITEVELKKIASTEHKRIKNEIKKSWKKIAVVVTPVCDFAQKGNKIFDRIVNGLLIPVEYKDYIDDKSEAVYILPLSINLEEKEYVLLVDFRFFVTINIDNNTSKARFRVRQELLSEIQSRLARHINRHGILLLDE